MTYQSVSEIDLDALTKGRRFHASPERWEDLTLYFLLVDRFSDGNENGYKDLEGKVVRSGKTARFDPKADKHNAVRRQDDAAQWREAATRFVGGNLKGLTSKLGYLKRLGVTALWISPVLKQCAYDEHSYHGYGTQNFLEIDPRFGSREEFEEMVETAHRLGIYVILDIIANHTGDVFAYDSEGGDTNYQGQQYGVRGWRDAHGQPTLPFGPVDLKEHPDAWPDGAVWPRELQVPEAFNRMGVMTNMDEFPQCMEGDFFSLKDLNLGHYDGDNFVPSETLQTLCKVYDYWIAYADLDGLRLDTLKNMGAGAARYFCDHLREFARTLGKDNFYILAEIQGSQASDADEMMEHHGVDAALWVGTMAPAAHDVITGRRPPSHYFDLHRGGNEEGGDMAWFRSHYVRFFDDHDEIGMAVKRRFASEYGEDHRRAEKAVLAAVGVIMTTLGIPCLYYGSEQAFNGHTLGEDGHEDFLREAMFGGDFGSWASRNRHFFDEDARTYQEVAKILAVRNANPALRRGEQYLRELSEDGEGFIYPRASGEGETYNGIIAWSRILDGEEFVCAVNTDFSHASSCWVTVDAEIHGPDSPPLKCLYSTDPEQVGTETHSAPQPRNGSAICLSVPHGGFVIYR